MLMLTAAAPPLAPLLTPPFLGFPAAAGAAADATSSTYAQGDRNRCSDAKQAQWVFIHAAQGWVRAHSGTLDDSGWVRTPGATLPNNDKSQRWGWH